MKIQIIRIIFFIATFIVRATSAKAELITLAGTKFDVIYDESSWGELTLIDNRIVAKTDFSFYASPGISIVTIFPGDLYINAHSGLALTGGVTIGISGNYFLPGPLYRPWSPNSSASLNAVALLFTGEAHDNFLGSVSVSTETVSSDQTISGVFAPVGPTDTAARIGMYQNFQLLPIISLSADPRHSEVSMTGLSFDIDVVPASTVPEPSINFLIVLGLVTILINHFRYHISNIRQALPRTCLPIFKKFPILPTHIIQRLEPTLSRLRIYKIRQDSLN